MKYSSVQRRKLFKENSAGVLDTGTRASDLRVDHPWPPVPPTAGETELWKGLPGEEPERTDLSENPQGSLHPSTQGRIRDLKELERAASTIESVATSFETEDQGALATIASSLRDLHDLLVGDISNAKRQVLRYLQRNRKQDFSKASQLIRGRKP